ncbi:MAG: lysozyme [Patescibacteria group bacterium]|nr:lysozyme [Patescibacteria group bacterium]
MTDIVVRARPVGQAALSVIRKWEGCAVKISDGQFKAYPDPATNGEPWTIGWGSTGPDIHAGLVWTQAQCDERLVQDAQRIGNAVQNLLGDASTTQNQYDALVSFAYNLGPAKLASSTLLKKHKAGDYAGTVAEFGKWINAGGRVMPGLISRRADEAALYRENT